MSRAVHLPTEAAVQAARGDVCAEAARQGRRPTVTTLARRVGLTNATFWRHFPQLARDLVDDARHPPKSPPVAGDTVTPADRIANLTRENRRLTDNLDLAVANIARLTLENHQLRQAVESATNVTRIDSSGGR